MKICVDTNAYSEYKKGDSAITRVLEEADQVFIPSVVLGELFAGFYLGSATKKNLLELDAFLSISGIYIIEISREIAEKYGNLIKILQKQGTPIPTNDIWIAAATLEYNAKLLSYDSHFEHVPGIMMVL